MDLVNLKLNKPKLKSLSFASKFMTNGLFLEPEQLVKPFEEKPTPAVFPTILKKSEIITKPISTLKQASLDIPVTPIKPAAKRERDNDEINLIKECEDLNLVSAKKKTKISIQETIKESKKEFSVEPTDNKSVK